MTDQTQIDRICIATLRSLSIDAVENAHSGHPGTPMGAAATAYCLWQYFLRYDPDDPEWPNRDRFVFRQATRRRCFTGCFILLV